MTTTRDPSDVGRDWVQYNPLTDTYDTPDGTSVAAYLLEDAACLAAFLEIANIRERQRNGLD